MYDRTCDWKCWPNCEGSWMPDEGFGLSPAGSGMEDRLPGGFRSITASVQTLDWRMGVEEGRSLTGGA